jgi:hypothetical protein
VWLYQLSDHPIAKADFLQADRGANQHNLDQH